VIIAGPLMNVLIAFVILWGLFFSQGKSVGTDRVDAVAASSPASTLLRAGDRLVAVDGARGDTEALRAQIGSHTCAGEQVDGCLAARPARLTVMRDGRLVHFTVRPRYSAADKRALVGFTFATRTLDRNVLQASGDAVSGMWDITTGTVSAITKIFYDSEARKEVSGVVGSYERTRQAVESSAVQAFGLLAVISMSLAIVNLFPFLPLDGGHVFWALAEKVRRRPIPFEVMERASVFGFLLVMFLFVIGLTNDINTLRGKGFGAP
jgi:regulator of sigma E protease